MDALVPAFIAALLAQAGDRPPWLAAILSSRYRTPLTIFVAVALVQAASAAIAVVGSEIVRPVLNPDARSLMLALALLFAGAGALWPVRISDRLDGWRIGAFATAFLGLLILALGDRTQFLTAGIALDSAHPVLAGIGAATGASAANLPAIYLGERAWCALPLKWLRIASGGAFLLIGCIMALGALRLI
ncbi:TMEM165/GDT1 family protein [Stakelama marina]|uniref:GDT1 family protein n=1 Tax=Stakelama marina TaxID=2826939 RepID=A0A8T4ILV8_9SPHN|nr:TMEM165/GDT1 family protein [Stakelama marina]MBR0553279.1 TMEM165/GDT1 family protein [Stakelama marina]